MTRISDHGTGVPERCVLFPSPQAGGKEPVGVSKMLHNFPPVGETTEPALRISGKGDPHDPISPSKKTMSTTKGNFQIPGYSGFVPGVQVHIRSSRRARACEQQQRGGGSRRRPLAAAARALAPPAAARGTTLACHE